MRVLIASAAALSMAAAAAAAMALHSPPARPLQRAQAAPRNLEATPKEAVPGLVWRSGGATLRLMGEPCPSAEFTQVLDSEGVDKARAYEVVQGSRRVTGCWTKDMGGDVVTIEPGRDLGQIPLDWFRRS